jgi:hypothetical protein
LRRHYSRIRFGLIAVIALAAVWTTIVIVTSAPASAEVSGPLLLAGSDCDEKGPFIQYRVSNESDGDETLALAVDSRVAIGAVRVESDETKRGRIEWSGDAADSVVLEARWATNDKASVSTISVAPNPCATTSAEGFTGPAFMAGTDCRDENALVRWWMSNTANEHRQTYVSISNEDDTTGETIWPGDGSSELMFAGAQTGGASEVPLDYAPGTVLRVSGWAEGTFGIAETWTQMVVPFCGPADTVIAGSSTIEAAATTTPQVATTIAIPTSAAPPEVATTIAGADETTTTTPGDTTTTVPGETTTTIAGSTTTGAPGATTTTASPTTTSRPPGSTTRPPPTTTTRTPTTTTTTTTTTSPPTGIEPPVFLAGADCNANGPYIRYRVTNNNASAQTLKVTFNGSTKVSNVSVGSGQTKWGTFGPGGGVNEPRPVVASWVGQAGSAAPTLLMRASICMDGLPQPARGPSFVAGQDCNSSGRPIVRWWMKNSAPSTQSMNVTLTKADNSGERIQWPAGGGTVDVDANVQAAGSFTLPSGYNSPGQEVRVRGWWRGIDASAHNRVGIIVASCG